MKELKTIQNLIDRLQNENQTLKVKIRKIKTNEEIYTKYKNLYCCYKQSQIKALKEKAKLKETIRKLENIIIQNIDTDKFMNVLNDLQALKTC